MSHPHVGDEDKTRGCQNAAPSVTDDLGRTPCGVRGLIRLSLIFEQKSFSASKPYSAILGNQSTNSITNRY